MVAGGGGRGRRRERADGWQVGAAVPSEGLGGFAIGRRRRGGGRDGPGGAGRGDPQAAHVAADGGRDRGAVLMALAKVSRWLKRIGLGKRSRLEPPEPANRYQRARPGELVHVDIKKLGRFPGRASASLATSADALADHRGRQRPRRGRLGLRPRLRRRRDQARLRRGAARRARRKRRRVPSARRRLVRPARRQGRAGDVRQRLLLRLARARPACTALGLRHLRTRPYRPRTNGKAERFIQTLQNEWAYGRTYTNSTERTNSSPLARPLQLPQTTRLPQPQTARSPPRRATNNLTRNNS